MATLGPAPAGAPLRAHLPGALCPPQAPNKALASILGKSNLRFAGMSVAVSISIDGLNLSVPATRQVSAARPAPQPPPAPPPTPSLRQPRPGQGLWTHLGEALEARWAGPLSDVQVLV